MNLMNKIYNDKEFINLASPVLTHKEFLKTKSIVHHGNTRYNHSVRVAYLSYKMSKVLRGDSKSTVRAGMLHDFFLERDDTNIRTETRMLIKHPSIAKENAINYFGVSDKEKNIIESHMFPISNVAPKSKEAWIVSICDKIVAIAEGASSAASQITLGTFVFINLFK